MIGASLRGKFQWQLGSIKFHSGILAAPLARIHNEVLEQVDTEVQDRIWLMCYYAVVTQEAIP